MGRIAIAWITKSLPSWARVMTLSREPSCWPEVEAEVVLKLIDRHRVANGVLDVLDRHAVLERRRMDIHMKQSYYETSDVSPEGAPQRRMGQYLQRGHSTKRDARSPPRMGETSDHRHRVVMASYLVVRGIAELFTIDVNDPDSYRAPGRRSLAGGQRGRCLVGQWSCSTSLASLSMDMLQPSSLSAGSTPGGRFSCSPTRSVPLPASASV